MSGRFRVLGPVEVWHDGRPGADLSPRQRTLLAALLVDRGRLVTASRLVERLWDDDPPPSASGTLQATVSRLRRVIDPGAADRVPGAGAASAAWSLRTRVPGYVLDVPATDVDSGRFEALLSEARTLAAQQDWEGAGAKVDAALGLWRGEPYEGVTASFVDDERRRLERLRLAAHELHGSIGLATGRHDEVIAWLAPLVEAEPWHEGLRAMLMVALYRAGRQGEALGAYDEARRILAEELGADPGPQLRRVLEQVLRHDPALLGPGGALPDGRVTAATPGRTPDKAPGRTPHDAPDESRARPATRLATGMPVRLTPFIGREREVAALAADLARQRLVTLVGPGGCGKTRLAIETARRLEGAASNEPTGPTVPSEPTVPSVSTTTAFVGLAGVDADEAIPAHLAATLGITLATSDPVAVLATALRGRRMLLVVDNCEHVVDGAASTVQALLTHCPELTVLATSRVPLDVEGEVVTPCGPFAIAGEDSEAVRFFADRAGRAAPHLAEKGLDPTLVLRICSELDGLPLAIELAAACLTTLSLEELAARVDDRFTLLAGGRRGAPPHQRTLAATIQWSLDLLDPAALRLFEVTSTFAGGFALDALEAVAGPGHRDVLGDLRRLVASSLVTLDHATGRYRMLETLRQFARTRLGEQEAAAIADRHAAFLADLVDAIEPTLRRRDGAAGWRRLDAEHDNLRVVLRRLLARAGVDDRARTLALRLAGGLGWWCYRRGHVTEGRTWLARSLGALDEPSGRPAPPEVVLRALLSDALLAYLGGDVAVVAERTTRMVELAGGRDEAYLALALVLRSFASAALGRPDAPPEPDRWLRLANRSGVDWVRAEIALTVGQFARLAGDHDAALGHLDRAACVADEVGHGWAWLSTKWIRAKVLIDLGRPEEALESLAAMLGGAVDEDDLTGALAGLLTGVGALAASGRERDAATLLGAVQALSRRIGYDPLAMDPLDGQRYVAAVTQSLDPTDLKAATESGGGLDVSAAIALLDDARDDARDDATSERSA